MTTATTTHGELLGERTDDLLVFRGIPFAAPPAGKLRWAPPQPAEPWSGVRDATRFGPAAPQAQSPVSQALAMNVGETGEDCLSLNVWTRSLGGKRPVMVWIHGGAFVIGSGSQDLYDGARMARRGDVVVVTINYRLGLFGFLHAKSVCGDALPATGNEAILDQVAALRWVKENIANFGGDPANVTIFGESAGSVSVATLLGLPAAKGLFQKAIQQSGSANLVIPAAVAGEVTKKLLDRFKLTPATAAKLRDVPADELMAAQNEVTPRAGGVAYGPVLDGEVLAESPFAVVARGGQAGVPLLAGTTKDEMKLFAFMDPGVFKLDDAAVAARAEGFAPGRGGAAIATYRAAREARGEPVTPFELYQAMATDTAMRVPTVKMAALQSSHTPSTFAYLLTHQSPSMGGLLGSPHAIDLPLVFGTYGIEAMKTFAGEGEAVERLSDQMMDAWLAFAKTGDPSHEGLGAWPRYEPSRRQTMILGPRCEVVDAPMEAERAFWEG
jgi:para-nitrobenzyl esterase